MLDTCLCFKFQIMSSRSVAPCELLVCMFGRLWWESGRAFCQIFSAVLFVLQPLCLPSLYHFTVPPPRSLCLPCLFSGCSCPAWIIYTHILDSLPSRLNHWPDCCGEIHCPLNSNITLITFNTMTMQGSWTWMNDIVWKIYLFKSSI